jgi:hypothetical protein
MDLRKQFRGSVPDPGRTNAQYRASGRFGEASTRRFSQHRFGEVGSFEAGVQRGGACEAGRVSDRSWVPQANRKTKEGDSHPDRNAQFEHINARVQHYMSLQQPVISGDTKKKELVGDFKNGGQDWRPRGKPEKVRVHDFLIPELGRAAPYGIHDLAQNTGWVSVGLDHDTASFAVETIRRWWHAMGNEKYPQAKRMMITADGGGSNGSGLRLWKLELQMLADETGLAIAVSHFPPGTSKWNKIEHRLFSFISKNWRGSRLPVWK